MRNLQYIGIGNMYVTTYSNYFLGHFNFMYCISNTLPSPGHGYD